jgi:hypothetical protein
MPSLGVRDVVYKKMIRNGRKMVIFVVTVRLDESDFSL